MSRPASRLFAAALALASCSPSTPQVADPGLAIAPLAEVQPGTALYSVTHQLYLVDTPEEGLIALSQRDPFRGCKVQYIEEGERIEGLTMEPEARFVDPCHGGEYDIAGRRISGPSEENLRRIPIEVIAGVVYIDPNPARDA